jgi:hypothetical protein
LFSGSGPETKSRPLGFFAKCKLQIRSVVYREGACTQIETIVRKVERFVEIQELKVNIRAALLVLGARLFEQFLREISTNDFGAPFSIEVS